VRGLLLMRWDGVVLVVQGGPKVLTEVDWHLQLVMGESILSRGRDTTAIFDMTLARPDVTTEVLFYGGGGGSGCCSSSLCSSFPWSWRSSSHSSTVLMVCVI